MSVYSRAIKHFDMDHVKELHEEKIKEEKIANIQEQQEKIIAVLKKIEMKEDLKFSNWRRDLENLDEGMTTASLGMVNYPAEGNVDLGTAISSFTLSGAGAGGFNSTTTDISGDSSEFDTMVIRISTSSSEWVIEPGNSIIGLASGGSGSHTVVIRRIYSSLYFSSKNDGSFTASVSYQRRAPINVFVSLDSPEANAFIRTDPSMQGLSSEEKMKKLKDMLEAGNEYLLKQLGITGSSAKPSDTTMPDSWEQASGNPRGDSVPIDPKTGMPYPFGPTEFPGGNPQAKTGSGQSNVPGTKDYGNVAQTPPGMKAPHTKIKYDKGMKGYVPDNTNADQILLDIIKKAKAYNDSWKAAETKHVNAWKAAETKHVNAWKKQLDLAHHEPQGEVLSEKKKLKSLKDIISLRCDIDEGMTTSGMVDTTLPAQGNVDLGQITDPIVASSPGSSQNGNSYTCGPANAGTPPDISGGLSIRINSTSFDTLVFDLIPGTINAFEMFVASDNGTRFKDYTLSSSAGTKVITLNKDSRKKVIDLVFTFRNTGSSIGTNVIQNLRFQRRAPVNVFVSLDSPEATAFIRTDPIMQGLSPGDRRKKLVEMLDAGNEYLLKQLGITGSSAKPSDTSTPDSWEQAAGGATDAMSDDLYNWVNKTYGLPAAEWKKDNPTKPDNSNPFLPKGSYVPKASGGKDYGNVAAKVRPVQGPSTEVYYDKKMKQFVPRNSGGVALDQIRKAHYEPKGETIMEKKKKSFKDLTNKIPGYYDGKPAPLGFPIQEPPKMVNGRRPDLVDGKNIANRYNRLDPISAKSMPKTGNPHIDKKVSKARMKSK